MARINKSTLTKLEIIRVASRLFLEKGYSVTTIKAISSELGMSTGNLTFYFPSKDHLLAELTEMLCTFQWKLISTEVNEGISSLMALCLELTAMAAMCEDNSIARDFYLSTYTSPRTLEILRKNDTRRAQQIFGSSLPHWKEENFHEAATLISGIEYATLMTTESSPPLEIRIAGALEVIMRMFSIPEETRKLKINKALQLDYRGLGNRIFKEFIAFVEQNNEQAIEALLSQS